MSLFECCCPLAGGRGSSAPVTTASLAAKVRKSRKTLADQQFRSAVKILLLGTGESGKSTILKQMKVLHVQGFSERERAEQIGVIRDNLHDSICEIISNMARLGIHFETEQARRAAQVVQDIPSSGDRMQEPVYVESVKSLMLDQGFQTCFGRANEYQLIDNVSHFLSRLEDICSRDFCPSVDDILRSRKITTGYHEVRFRIKVPKSNYYQEFRMFDVGGQREERTKWIHVFEGIEALLFVISCSDYDQTLREDGTTNRLSESFSLFHRVWHNGFLTGAGLICFLNKQDILEEKIRRGHQIPNDFPGFAAFCETFAKKCRGGGGGAGKGPDAVQRECERTRCFIRESLEKVTAEPPRRMSNREFAKRDCYFHFTTATDSENIKRVFDNVHVIILNEMLSRVSLM